MGLFSGSVTVTKYFVRGAVPKRYAASFLSAIRLRVFTELTVDQEEAQTSGWCVASSPLDLELDHGKVFLESYVALAMRVDKWRVPRPLFKAQFAEAQQAMRERTGKERLSQKDKAELKFRIERRLRKKVLPQMRHFDVVWNVERSTLLLWSRSPRVKEDFQELFEQTFKLELDENSPYLAAKQLLGEESLSSLSELEAMSIAARSAEGEG